MTIKGNNHDNDHAAIHFTVANEADVSIRNQWVGCGNLRGQVATGLGDRSVTAHSTTMINHTSWIFWQTMLSDLQNLGFWETRELWLRNVDWTEMSRDLFSHTR